MDFQLYYTCRLAEPNDTMEGTSVRSFIEMAAKAWANLKKIRVIVTGDCYFRRSHFFFIGRYTVALYNSPSLVHPLLHTQILSRMKPSLLV
jgi:hypothetical protein